MKRTKLNPRKVLIASAGIATINYISTTACGGRGESVANLVAPPQGGTGGAQMMGGGTGGSPYVANLVAPPQGGTGGSLVANLVAPPPMGGSTSAPRDASTDAPVFLPDASGDDAGLTEADAAG